MGEACAGPETCRRGPAACMGAVSDSGPERRERESWTRARDHRASPQAVGTRTGCRTRVEASVAERVRDRLRERNRRASWHQRLKTVSDKIRCGSNDTLSASSRTLPRVCPLSLHLIAHDFLRHGSRCPSVFGRDFTHDYDAVQFSSTPPSDMSTRLSYMNCESAV